MESSTCNSTENLQILKKPKLAPNFKQAQLLFSSKAEKNDSIHQNTSKKRKLSEITPGIKLKIDNMGCKRPLVSDKITNQIIIIDDDIDEVSSSCELTTKHQMEQICGHKLTQIDRFFKKVSKPLDVSTSSINDDVDLMVDEGNVANDEFESDIICVEGTNDEKENMDVSCENLDNKLQPHLVDSVLKSEPNLNVAKNNEKLIKPRLSSSYKLERFKQKEEKEKLKNEEKERKEKEKQLSKEKKEQERLEKEREKEEKRIQREEEKKIKLEQIEDEKRKKEEARLEEKRKREEEKKKEEEKLEKKDKVSTKEKQLMQNFFKITAREKAEIGNQVAEIKSASIFRPFELKKDMKLAPTSRYIAEDSLSKINQLDFYILNQDIKSSYLKDLKIGNHLPKKIKKSLEREDDIFIVPKPTLCRMKAKLLQFHDNYRPAYYGTWRKQSILVRGRVPFGRDEKWLDYSVDSDEEWEEEEPGESISHSEGEEETQEEVVEEVDGDDDFFVPHGYLSEGEGCADDDDLSPEFLKMQQQFRARNWEVEMKSKKIEKLRPICTGVVWYDSQAISNDRSWQVDMLKDFKVGIFDTLYTNDLLDVTDATLVKSVENPKKKIFMPLSEEAMPDLIRLVHGNRYSRVKMIKEFKEFLLRTTHSYNNSNVSECSPSTPIRHAVSKRQLSSRIHEIATYKKNNTLHRFKLWYVKPEILEKYCLLDLPVPTNWKWITNSKFLTPNEDEKLDMTPTDTSPEQPLTPHLSSVPKKQTSKRLSLNFNVDGKTFPSQTCNKQQLKTNPSLDIISVLKKQTPRRIQTVNVTSESNYDDKRSPEKLEKVVISSPNDILSVFKKQTPRRIQPMIVDDKLELDLKIINSSSPTCKENAATNFILPAIKKHTPRRIQTINIDSKMVTEAKTLSIQSDIQNLSCINSLSPVSPKLSVPNKLMPRRINTVIVDSKFTSNNTLHDKMNEPNQPALENVLSDPGKQKPRRIIPSSVYSDTEFVCVDITGDSIVEIIVNKNELEKKDGEKKCNFSSAITDIPENHIDDKAHNNKEAERVYKKGINIEKLSNLDLIPPTNAADNVIGIDVTSENDAIIIENKGHKTGCGTEINTICTINGTEEPTPDLFTSDTSCK